MNKKVTFVILLLVFSSDAFSENKLMNSLEEKFVNQVDYKLIYQHKSIPSDISKWITAVPLRNE